MSSIMKGIVDEGDKSNPFQDGYDAWKAYQAGKTNYPKCPYPAGQGMGQWHEGQAAAAEEGDYDVNETEAKKGADGKRCWKGKRYAGTENGKDKCIPVKNEAANPAQQAAIAISKKEKANEGVIVGHDANDPEVAILGGAGTMSLSRLKKKAHGEALQLADDIANGKYNASSYNMKQLHNTLNTIVAAEEEMKKNYFGEDYTGEFAAEKTPTVNPHAGIKDNQFRGAISETPTDNPTGSSGEGGWRKYKPKSAGTIKEGADELKAFLDQYPEAKDAMQNAVRHFEYAYDAMDHVAGHVLHKMPYAEFSKVRPELIAYFKKYGLKGDAVNDIDEDTSFGTGMGQGGNAGESYRKFKPKSAGTFKESAIMKGLNSEGI